MKRLGTFQGTAFTLARLNLKNWPVNHFFAETVVKRDVAELTTEVPNSPDELKHLAGAPEYLLVVPAHLPGEPEHLPAEVLKLAGGLAHLPEQVEVLPAGSANLPEGIPNLPTEVSDSPPHSANAPGHVSQAPVEVSDSSRHAPNLPADAANLHDGSSNVAAGWRLSELQIVTLPKNFSPSRMKSL